MAQTYPPPIDRVLAKIDVQSNGCWKFTGKINCYGYGKVNLKGRNLMAHRVTFEHCFGAIPSGLGLDHICHDPKTCSGGTTCPHRRCVNPHHLQIASAEINNSPQRSVKSSGGILKAIAARAAQQKAKTHCPKAHEYTEENTRMYRGKRHCRECMRRRSLAWYHRRRAQGLPRKVGINK